MHSQNSNPFKHCTFIVVIFSSLVNDDCIVWSMHSAHLLAEKSKLIKKKKKRKKTNKNKNNRKQIKLEPDPALGIIYAHIKFNFFLNLNKIIQAENKNVISERMEKCPFADLMLNEYIELGTGYWILDTMTVILERPSFEASIKDRDLQKSPKLSSINCSFQ